ncbi:MAG: phosphotransferase family protein [Chloroflexota bacterium]
MQPTDGHRYRTGDLIKAETLHHLRMAFPDVDVALPVRVLGNGSRNLVLEAASLVFRIAKSADALQGHLREMRLLPVLAPHLPIAIPEPRLQAAASPSLPYGAIGYHKLPGVSLGPEKLNDRNSVDIATQVASFLVSLHTFPSYGAPAVALPDVASREAGVRALRDTVLPPLSEALSADEYGTIVRWWGGFLKSAERLKFDPVIVHGDLWYENVLVDETAHRVVGVVDFESAAWGDRAQDFATLLHLGEHFMWLVQQSYRQATEINDPNLDKRIEMWWQMREFDGIANAIRMNDDIELLDGIRKLRAGPILKSDV